MLQLFLLHARLSVPILASKQLSAKKNSAKPVRRQIVVVKSTAPKK